MTTHVDPSTGHVTIRDTDGTVIATLLDMGGSCAVDATVSMLTPDQAYEYGTAVLRWACQKRRQQRARQGGGSQ